MSARPPAGWYPDPEWGGARWRWWDGERWAQADYGYGSGFNFDPEGFARTLEQQADTTARTGQWLRWVLAANAVSVFLALVGMTIVLRRGFDFGSTDPDGTFQFSGAIVAVQLVTIPLNLVSLASLVLLIGWIYNAGKFADLQRWPSVRGRTLGAFSLLIPIVSLWWPYVAVRELYPPGVRSPLPLRWWLSYLIVPFATAVPVLITALTGPTALCAVVVALAGGALAIPVVLGWRLIDDVAAMQRAYLPRSAP